MDGLAGYSHGRRAAYDLVLRDCHLVLRDDINRFPPEMALAKRVLSTEGLSASTYYSMEPKIAGRRGYDGKDWNGLSEKLRLSVRSLWRPLVRMAGAYPGEQLEKRLAG